MELLGRGFDGGSTVEFHAIFLHLCFSIPVVSLTSLGSQARVVFCRLSLLSLTDLFFSYAFDKGWGS